MNAHHALLESRVSHDGNPQLVSFADMHQPSTKQSLTNPSYPQVIHFSSDDIPFSSTPMSTPILTCICRNMEFYPQNSLNRSIGFQGMPWNAFFFIFHQGGLWLKRFHMRFASCPLRRCRLQPGLFRKSGRGKRQLGTRSVLGDRHSRRLRQSRPNSSGFGDHQILNGDER